MRPCGVDDFTATLKELVAKFENAQIGPGARTLSDNHLQRLLGRPIRARLRQDQRRRCGRARDPRMAMDEEMRASCLGEIASEGEELLDIEALRHKGAGAGVNNVVEAQLKAPMRVESAKGLGLGPAGIEDRQHVSDACLAMEAELVDPANRHLERH